MAPRASRAPASDVDVAPPLRLSAIARRWLWNRLDAYLGPAGVRLDGGRAWDPQILRMRAVLRVLANGTLGAGEAYVDGDWECDALDEMVARLLCGGAGRRLAARASAAAFNDLAAILTNPQRRGRARADIRAHYDAGNDFYRALLGPTMAYSCGYWSNAASLDEAQEAKLDLVCRKLGLAPGMRVLDIGCGWGSFALHAASRYGVAVVGITLSHAQAELARDRCRGLPVEIDELDYRDMTGTFDRIVSIGMFEHVGPKNYHRFFAVVARHLREDGLFLLHTIGGSEPALTSDPWLDRYVFPGSVLPSVSQIARAIDGRFVLEDWHNFGADYDRTLLAWHANLEAAAPLHPSAADSRWLRLFRYYLLTCAGTFRARHNQLWQLVLSPHGVGGGYRRPL